MSSKFRSTRTQMRELLLIAILAIALSGCETPQVAFEAAINSDNIAKLEDFVKKYPSSPQALQARARLTKMQSERDWLTAVRIGTIEAYKEYLRLWIVSSRRDEARDRITKLEYERDWTAASTSNDISKLQEFVRRYPDSKESSEASSRLAAAVELRAWKGAMAANTYRAYRTFIEDHITSEFVAEARSRIAKLEQFRGRWEALLKNPSAANFKRYYEENPESPYAPEARAAVADANTRSLIDLIKEDKIAVEGLGDGIDRMKLVLRRKTSYPLSISIPIGIVLAPTANSVQSMITTSDSSSLLATDLGSRLSIDVACLNMRKQIPRSGDRFYVRTEAASDEFIRVLHALENEKASFFTRQAALWILSDDASYRDMTALAYVTTNSTGFEVRRSEAIQRTNAAIAMRILFESGVNVKQKRIWQDRSTIANGLSEQLRDWLKKQE